MFVQTRGTAALGCYTAYILLGLLSQNLCWESFKEQGPEKPLKNAPKSEMFDEVCLVRGSAALS